MSPAWRDSLLMKAARREPVERTPIWLMRQAGRYMPEYRELRRKVGFLELCRNPALAADVMLRTVERLGVDAAILFSDLLLILEPMGLRLEFTVGDGPVLDAPIRTAADVDRLAELDDLGPLEHVFEAVRLTRAGLDERLPLIGFAGAPFTLAAYAVEGGGSRDYRRAKRLMYADEGAWNALLARIARAVARYLAAQVEAGAQVVQLFDSWVGCLGPDDYRRYVLPHSAAVIAAMPPGVPVIHFATGNPALVPLLGEALGDRPDGVVGVDWRVRLDAAWAAVDPARRAIQGNLDPAVLLTDPDTIRRRAGEVLDQADGRPGHIFNLGHGVLPDTPVENVLALVEAVRGA
jgi:uroporphyrinogen decarboxylase